METLTFRPEERDIVLYNKAISQGQALLWAFNYFSADYYNPRKPVFDLLPFCLFSHWFDLEASQRDFLKPKLSIGPLFFSG